MSRTDQWFKNEIDSDEEHYELVFLFFNNILYLNRTYPQALLWGLLVETQQQNPFRSTSFVGWCLEACVFKVEID
jgi:hypothetical protein